MITNKFVMMEVNRNKACDSFNSYTDDVQKALIIYKAILLCISFSSLKE